MTAASTRSSEMNETSIVASAIGSGSVVEVSVRAFVRSIETTRRSRRRGAASWPRPTSSAYTRVAPRWSRTSVNPPVDAPTSRQTRPVGSIPNASRAAASLWPPRLTYGSGASTSTLDVASTRSPGLRSWRAASPSPTRTLPASTSAWARVARLGEPTLDEQLVETDPSDPGPGLGRCRGVGRTHPPIVAQPASLGLIAGRPRPVPWPDRSSVRSVQGAARSAPAIREASGPMVTPCRSCPFRPGSAMTTACGVRSRIGGPSGTASSRRSSRASEPGGGRRNGSTGSSSARRSAIGSSRGRAVRRARGSW